MKRIYKWVTRSVTNITTWFFILGVTSIAVYMALTDEGNTSLARVVIVSLYLFMFIGFNYITYLKVKKEERLIEKFGQDYIKFLNKHYK